MKFFVVLSISFLLSGCWSLLPVKYKFPDIPDSLKEPCTELKLLEDDTYRLSEVLKIVTSNYAEYHICSAKVDAWQTWYTEQKKIFESIK